MSKKCEHKLTEGELKAWQRKWDLFIGLNPLLRRKGNGVVMCDSRPLRSASKLSFRNERCGEGPGRMSNHCYRFCLCLFNDGSIGVYDYADRKVVSQQKGRNRETVYGPYCIEWFRKMMEKE
jgi:hypothetical protein